MLTELDRQDTDTSGDHTAYPYLGLDTLADNLQGESALEPFPKFPPAYPLRVALSSVCIKNENFRCHRRSVGRVGKRHGTKLW